MMMKMKMKMEKMKMKMKMKCSVPNSSDGPIFEKRRAKDGRFLNKNTGVRRAKRRAKFKLVF